MKQIFFLFAAFVVFANTSSAQITITGKPTGTRYNKGSAFTDSVLGIPVRDTIAFSYTSELRNVGRITLRPQDSTVYVNNGTKWVAVGKATGADSSIYATRYYVDSTLGSFSNFTALSGTTWDGNNKYTTLTANTTLTLSGTQPSGMLRVKQDATGNRALTINTTSIAIGKAADKRTLIGFVYANGEYLFSADSTLVVATTVVVPNPPTGGIVNDTAKTFDFTYSTSTSTIGDYEYSVNGGSTWTTAAVKPIAVPNMNIAIGDFLLRVRAIGGNPASSTISNASAYHISGTPSEIYSRAWLTHIDADSGVTITSGVVSNICDLQHDRNCITGVTSYDFHYSTVPTAPLLQSTNSFNGHSSFRVYDSVNAHSISQSTPPIDTFPITYFIVAKANKLPATGEYRYFIANPSTQARFGIGNSSGTVGYFAYNGGGVAVSGTPDTSAHIFCVEFNKTGSNNIWVDNASTAVYTQATGSNTFWSGVTLGIQTFGNCLDANITKFLVYKGTFNSTERAAIMAELKTRYNTP